MCVFMSRSDFNSLSPDGDDYVHMDEDVTLVFGTTEMCVTVIIVSDNCLEDEEQFAVELLVNSDFATVVESTALVIILREQGGWKENHVCLFLTLISLLE